MNITTDEVLECIITDLRGIEDTLSGDDSPLTNVWEEIKDQVQNGESIHWYLQTMKNLIERAIYEPIKSGKIDVLPYCNDVDQEEMVDFFLEMLLSRAEEELVECVPFDFKYFCYPAFDFTIYGEIIKRTGLGTCQAKVYSIAELFGEVGIIQVSRIDSVLSKENFSLAQKQGWPKKWECT
jgi:hypothetical protein